MPEVTFTTGEWTSTDGLVLRYRDYAKPDLPSPAGRPPMVCIPGLTRNARDFEPLAEAFAGEWRMVCVDLRGRGQSDYAKDPASYNPAQYAADVALLFDHLGLKRAVMVGTSLGGIVTMLLAEATPERVAAAVLNDIGPEVEAAGLARIRGYVGQGRSFPTWTHAARALREQAGHAYPGHDLSDWLRLARRLMCVSGSGRIVLDYDMKIAELFNQPVGDEAVSNDADGIGGGGLWRSFGHLAGRPVLVLNGELSDIVSPATLARMQREVPGLQIATIPRTGHPPTLEEPEALAAIGALLDGVA